MARRSSELKRGRSGTLAVPSGRRTQGDKGMNYRIAVDEVEHLESQAREFRGAARFVPTNESHRPSRQLTFLEILWNGARFEYRIEKQIFTRDQAIAILTTFPE